MSIILERIQLHNYRSCQRTDLHPHSRLTVLIGPNGSGKSNVLNGIMLLRKVIHSSKSRPLDTSAQSKCAIKAWFRIGKGCTIPYEAELHITTDERNSDEVIAARERWNFREITGDNNWIDLSSDRRETLYLYDDKALKDLPPVRLRWIQRINKYILGRHASKIAGPLSAIRKYVKDVSYYGASQFTDPTRCAIYFELEGNRLSRRFTTRNREHLQFLFDLFRASQDPKSRYAEFESFVGRSGLKLVDKIEFKKIKAPANVYDVRIGGRIVRNAIERTLIIPSFRIGRNRLSPNQLSEGTLKTLALIFYLLTDRARLLLLEEPEVCVHHGLLNSVVEIIKAVSTRKQVVLSTHSDFVLDAVTPENVYVVNNDLGRGTTIEHVPGALSTSEFAGLKQYLSESGNLGEYWRHGGLER